MKIKYILLFSILFYLNIIECKILLIPKSNNNLKNDIENQINSLKTQIQNVVKYKTPKERNLKKTVKVIWCYIFILLKIFRRFSTHNIYYKL